MWTKKIVKPISKKITEKVGAAIARYGAGGVATAGPEATVVGRAIAYAIANAIHIMDYLWTTIPFIAAIEAGYSASEEMQDSIECYEFTRTDERIVADPPNCRTYAEREWYMDIIPIPHAKCDDEPVSYGKTTYFEDTCSDCPNYFVSVKERGDNNINWEKHGAKAVMGGSRAICLVATIASPTGGMACSAVWYFSILTSYKVAPGEFVAFFTGVNLVPKDRYYYMAFPLDVGVSKVYNNAVSVTNQKSYLHVEKNKEELVI